MMVALSRAAQKRVTIISAPAGTGKTSLLRARADQPGQEYRIAFVTVRPGQHDMQLFWLTLLSTVRAATCAGEDGAQLLPVTPGSGGSAMVDKVLSELPELAGDAAAARAVHNRIPRPPRKSHWGWQADLGPRVRLASSFRRQGAKIAEGSGDA